MMQAFEKLGGFYLGKRYDPAVGVTDDVIVYDARDLTTHAVCVGMTGSGKTGLCLSLLEEAAIDGIPAIAIDPKGDLANLLLTFPDLRPSDFQPWLPQGESARRGQTSEEHARDVAELWRKGLTEWGQDGERIRRMRETTEFAVYTPGSSSGRPISLLRSLRAPPAAVLDDADALRDRVSSAVSGLLTLVGIEPDPVRSREHILLSTLLDRAWRGGRDLEMAELIRLIQNPPMDRVGVIDLETFYPANDRFALAMTINNLLASPGFAAWMEGEPLDAGRLLWDEHGRPRISILSIAHLSDTERMFFVTMLLDEVLSWVRTQPGSSSLRAILYMDEVFGFFPPVANPPSKTPMLTLLKQARAFGLGIVLATQNPVDLDYKGLSNAGTWFLGRLQTERDKLRVLDGLESAASNAGGFNRKAADEALSGLPGRVFLLHNVHDDGPVLMHTRWALSYLRGPMTRDEIRRIGGETKRIIEADTSHSLSAEPGTATRRTEAIDERPLVPPGVTERFAVVRLGSEGRRTYRPGLLGRVRLHYVNARRGIDEWVDLTLLGPAGATANARWEEAVRLDDEPGLESAPAPGFWFEPLPAKTARKETVAAARKALADWAYRSAVLTLWSCGALGAWSEPGESDAAFRVRVAHLARERRDLAVEKLRMKYAPKLRAIEKRLQTAEQRLGREQSQYVQQRMQTAISLGATVLGAVLGRKMTGVRSVGRATAAARGASRVSRERDDIARAQESIGTVLADRSDLEREMETETEAIRTQHDPTGLTIEAVEIRSRKADIAAAEPVLVWVPMGEDADGLTRRLI
jgi:DNA helicase HerA-like ATPase